MRHHACSGLCAFGVVLASVWSAAAAAPRGNGAPDGTASSLRPVADAYVSAARPNANFGKAGTLLAGGRLGSTVYLRFRVAVPAGAEVRRALLRLSAATRSTGGFTVHPVADSAWSESTLSYANAPRVDARIAGASGGYRANAYVTVDVTSLVTGSGVVSLAVKGEGGSQLAFRSRESGARAPRLVVDTSAATAPPPAAGTGVALGAGPCGAASGQPRRVDHVVWIWMENKPYESVIGAAAAPYVNGLAAACGLATNYHALTHPSLPNYIAATSGDTQGITDDEPPSAHPIGVPSIFSQVKDSGRAWREYAESAPGPCFLGSSGDYAVKHDPAAYYLTIRGDCAAGWDVPMGTPDGGSFANDLAAGTLPAFSFVTPDLCHDTHDCSVATGDAWLQSWFAKILASSNYRSGSTVVFVVWDENDGSGTNHVPLLVVSPSTPAGARPGDSFDHYSLLKTTEQLLGLPLLGHAGDAGTPAMSSAFGLG